MARATTAPSVEDRVAALEAELTATKQKHREERVRLVDIAQRYAKNHNLCSVVDQALTEAGLFGQTVKKKITADVSMEVYIDVDAEIFDGMTEDEQKEALQKAQITGVVWKADASAVRGVANGTRQLTQPTTNIGEIVVKSVETVDANAVISGTTGNAVLPAGFLALYTAPEGRVLHIVEAIGLENRNVGSMVNVDGVDFRVRNTPLCGRSMWGYGNRIWMPTSTRSVGRYCQGCRDVSVSRYAIPIPRNI